MIYRKKKFGWILVMVAALAIFFVGCGGGGGGSSASSDDTVTETSNSPNSKNWEWYTYVQGGYALYSQSASSDNGIIKHEQVQLPFFDPNSPAGSDLFYANPEDVDMHREDGWVLWAVNFGSQDKAPSSPYFLLYNKQRGVGRLFIFPGRSMPDYSYLIVQIDQPRYDKTTGILALDAKNAALDKYDKTRVMAIMCKGIYRHWSYIDFPMQYDPAILDISDASVRFTIVGVNESSVYLTGDMSLQQVVYQAQLHSEDDSLDLSQIFSAGQRAYLAYKDARSQVESLRAEAAAHPNSWLGQLITGIDTAAPLAGKWYPVVKAATGLVSYFMQQGNKGDSTTTPIQLEGVFSASGSISSFAPIDQITVGVPGCKFTPTNPEGNIQPLFDDPVGVFALNKMPQIQLDFDDVMQDCVGSIYHPVKIIYWNVIGSLKEPLEVVINQIPGYDITVNAAFVYNQEDFNEKYPGKFVEITTFNQATIAPVKLHLACHEYYRGAEIDILEWLKTHNKGDGVYSDYLPKVALEVEVKKTSSDEDPFRVIKVYPVKYVTSVGSFSYHACPKEPLPPKEPR